MERPNKENINFRYNLKAYLSFLKRYKLLFISVLLLVLYIEAGHAIVKFFFKIVVDRGGEFFAGAISKSAFVKIVSLVGFAYLLVIILSSVASFFSQYLLTKLETGIIYDLKKKYFNHVIHLSHNFHTTHRTGTMISRLIRGGKAMEGFTDVIVFNFSPLVIQLFIVSGALLLISWVPALISLLTVISFLTFSFLMQSIQKKSNIEAVMQDDFEKGNISDIFTNIDSIKYFGKENFIKRKFDAISNKTKEKFRIHWNYHNWVSAGQSLILSIGLIAAIYFPMVDLINGSLTLGEFVFIYTIYGNLIGPMFSFVHGIRNYYRLMADFEALFEYGKIENEIKDAKDAKNLEIGHGNIEFNNISFKYLKRGIFSSFNLKINKNEKVALVGHSGCGKSTLIKLLYRLYDIESGEILIDNKNIMDVKQESLRSELSIVPQECVLFDDTIYNNIKFSNPKASRKQVLNAIKFAQLDYVIKEMPNKENTIVGERGVRLSGGEKQRVSIARAVLANKKILVLDEATSSLDSKTEYEIQKDLKKLMKNRTSIIIAHRLSTIMHADKIVVMSKGKIVQIGSHKDLINKKGEYKKLWNLQKGGYIK
ncbi:MAG: ABC transporter ATP-binding protein [Nanoarchaeota archaeon]|nr:ABC transporter ATP-binding protein [Nanoarchaeota archaeon]